MRDLKNEKGSGCALYEQLDELGNIHDHAIESVVGGSVENLLLGRAKTFRLEIEFERVGDGKLDSAKLPLLAALKNVLGLLKLEPRDALGSFAGRLAKLELVMQVDELGEAVVWRGRDLNAFGLFGVAYSRALKQHAKFDKPVAEETCDHLENGHAGRHHDTELWILLNFNKLKQKLANLYQSRNFQFSERVSK